MIFVSISVVIDITEKMQDFMDKQAPLSAIIFDYYFNFIPFIGAMLGPFFVFITVIYFTSRMTQHSEIVSIVGNGISYYRLLRPFVITALILVAAFWYANNWLVPQANKKRLAFEQLYVRNPINYYSDIELVSEKTAEGESIVSLKRYSKDRNEGFRFSLKKLRHGLLQKYIYSPRIVWNEETKKWRLNDYNAWIIEGQKDSVFTGQRLDTALGFSPADFIFRLDIKEAMTARELNNFIKAEKEKGSEKVPYFQVEKHLRTSNAFSILILTLIGLAFSTRKIRGGIGFQLALGLLISTLYILFIRFSTTFATNANLPAIVAVWIPNIVFGLFALALIKWTPK